MFTKSPLKPHLTVSLGSISATEASKSGVRNGVIAKTLKTEDGEFEMKTPRDRDGSFEPQQRLSPTGSGGKPAAIKSNELNST